MTLMQRRRALMAAKKERPVMNPAFGYTDGYVLQRDGMSPPYLVSQAGCAVTDFIDGGTAGNAVTYFPSTTKPIGNMLQYATTDDSALFTQWWGPASGATKTRAVSSNTRYIRFGFDPDTMADLYGYNDSTGDVYFAGINTPYYGKTNIND